MANKRPPSVTEARREIPRMLQTIRDRDYYSVVRDFFELSAISVRNTFDFTKRDEFEKRYLNVAKQYSRDQLETFASCLGLFMGEIEAAKNGSGEFRDLTPEQRERVNKGLSPYRRDTKVNEYKYSKGRFV